MIIQNFKDKKDIPFPNEKSIIIIGAGVSIDSPSCLPSGYELTEFFIERVLGKKVMTYFFDSWKEVNKIVGEFPEFKLNYPIVRLELILQSIDEIDKEFQLQRNLEILKNFDYVNYNYNHILLNKLGEKGYKLITANFDGLIEKVNQEIKVCHFHGTNSDIETIGATIKNIKGGLNFEISRYLITLINQDYNLIFVGYSFSDFFDIIPFFKSISDEKYNGLVYIFSHGKALDEQKIIQLNDIFKNFKRVYNLYGNTLEFLTYLNDEKNVALYYKDIIIWKKQIFPFQEEFRIFYLIKIFNQTGLKITEKVIQLLDEDVNDLYELLELACKRWITHNPEKYLVEILDKNKSVLSDILDLGDEIDHNGFHFNQVKAIFNSNLFSYTFRNIVDRIKFEELYEYIIGYTNLYSQENWYFDTVIVYPLIKFSKHYILKSTVFNNNDNLKRISELLNLVTKLPYYKFRYISYYLSLCKVKNIVDILLNKEDAITDMHQLYIISLEMSQFSEFAKLCYNHIICVLLKKCIHKEYEYNEELKDIDNYIMKLDNIKLINVFSINKLEIYKNKRNRLLNLEIGDILELINY